MVFIAGRRGLLIWSVDVSNVFKCGDRVVAIKDHEGFYKAGDRGIIIGVVHIPTMPYHILFDDDAPGRTLDGKWWADDTTVRKLLPEEDRNTFLGDC